MTDDLLFENAFTKRLPELRMKKGVSAREMSLAIGQNEGYINGIENGKALPSMMSFSYICQYLEISPRDFFDIDVKDPGKLTSIIEKMKKLKDEQLTALETIIDNMK